MLRDYFLHITMLHSMLLDDLLQHAREEVYLARDRAVMQLDQGGRTIAALFPAALFPAG